MTKELGWIVLLLLVSAGKGSAPKGPPRVWPKPPPDEDLGVHPLPPNPLKKK